MKRLGILVVIVLILSGCQSINDRNLVKSETIIDWVDFIRWDGVTYDGIHTGVLADQSYIGEKLGEVQFKVADQVSDPYYKLKNGDAAFHKEGTAIYSILDHPQLIAVENADQINGYSVYYDREDSVYKWHFKNVPIKKVNRIELYQLYTAEGTILINEISEPDAVETFLQLLIEGEENPHFEPDTLKRDPDYFEMVLYTDDPIAYKNSILYDGTHYYWYPWETSILAEEIGEFVREK